MMILLFVWIPASAGMTKNVEFLRSKAGAAVRTASIWQVRQGIYTTSTRRWRHYQQHLQLAITLLQLFRPV